MSVLLVIGILFTSCASSSTAVSSSSKAASSTAASVAPPVPSSSAPAESKASATPVKEEFVIKLGHHHNLGSATDKMANKFKELMEAKSNGRVRVDVYGGAQLGQEVEAAEGVLIGAQEMTCISPTNYINVVEGYGIDTVPFMFSGWEDMWYAFNETEFGDILENNLIKAGARIVGWTPLGGRHMIFVNKNITTIDQLQGLKMRSPENEIYMSMFNALGARPTPITWGEAYTALQTNVVDGMETPIYGLSDMNFGEVTKYCLLTSHMWGVFAMVINEKLYQSFPADVQKLVTDCGLEAVRFCYDYVKSDEDRVKKLWEDKGIVFNELTEADRVKLAEKMVTVKDKWIAGGPGRTELIAKLQEVLAKKPK